jgi:basic membrane protein A
MENNVSRRKVLSAVGSASALGLAGCTGETTNEDDAEITAAFLYESELAEVGWDRSHENGRQFVEEQLDWVDTEFTENVPPGDLDQVMGSLVDSGVDAIFGTTFGYMDPMVEFSTNHPDVAFEHCSGYKTTENMGRYYGRLYQARYLCGVAAGELTDENQIGYCAAFPIPEVLRQINAFVAGARDVNPDVTAEIRFTNDWLNPSASTEAVEALTNNGADVINNHQTSTAAVETAARNDAWAFTYTTDMIDAGGERYGSSAVFNWGPYYEETIRNIRNDEWDPNAYWKGLDAGIVDIGEFGSNVPDDVVSEVENVREEIINGERTVWENTQFEGESDEFLFGEMNSFVEGISGEVPSS